LRAGRSTLQCEPEDPVDRDAELAGYRLRMGNRLGGCQDPIRGVLLVPSGFCYQGGPVLPLRGSDVRRRTPSTIACKGSDLSVIGILMWHQTSVFSAFRNPSFSIVQTVVDAKIDVGWEQ
jgi:hypothetical protein